MRIESNLPNTPVGNSTPSVVALSRPGFSQALAQTQSANVKVIQAGDTLTSIVRDQAQKQGVKLSASEEFRWAQALAADSGITNPNAIFPGQKVQLQNMLSQWQAGQTQPNQAAGSALNTSNTASASTSAAQPLSTAAVLNKSNVINAVAHPVLSQTLDRAVARGFIPKVEKQDVYNKVLQVANKHNFSPDDFARLTLMESDGMNPKASNNRCHGIIQFCDGPDRGAASAGFGANPKAILGHSVLQQLDMVGKYFEDTGLKNFGPVGLDDLYLTVLTPAARNETRPNAALNIPGQQAAYLHVNRDMRAPITRNSILAGLHQNANERLNKEVLAQQQPRNTPLQAARLSAYAAQAVVTDVR